MVGLTSSIAAPGKLDPTFGSGGKVSTDLGYQQAAAAALVIQSDGKLVAGGVSWNGANYDFALARYNADGSLDSAFGSGGKVLTDFGAGSDAIGALVLQADGKIVATGRTTNSSATDTSFALARYNANGSLDASFGSGGKVTVDFAVNNTAVAELSRSVLIQPDGKIVAAGFATMPGTNRDFAVVRLNANGSLDSSFGAGGKATKDFYGGADSGAAVVLRSDGKLWVAGTTAAGGTKGDDVALVRFTASGVADQTATADLSNTDLAAAAALQPDGKLVVAGARSNGVDLDFLLMRYNADGTIDTGFGTQGATVSNWGGNDRPAALALQGDGKPVAVGWRWNGSNYDFAIARYSPNGNPDTSFGTGGLVSVDFSGNDYGNAVAIQSDGKIVAAGQDPTEIELFGLVRLVVTEDAAPPPGGATGSSVNHALAIYLLETIDNSLSETIRRVRTGRLDGRPLSVDLDTAAAMKLSLLRYLPPIYGQPAALVFPALEAADEDFREAREAYWYERAYALDSTARRHLARGLGQLKTAFPPTAALPPQARGLMNEIERDIHELDAKIATGKFDPVAMSIRIWSLETAKAALIEMAPDIFGVPALRVFDDYERIDVELEDAVMWIVLDRKQVLAHLRRAIAAKTEIENGFKDSFVPYSPPPIRFPLIDQNYPSDGGHVVSEPDGNIDCPTRCSHDYDAGTNVGLRAIPKPGYRFVRWLGGPCTGTATVKTCTVVMDRPRVIRAEFEKIPGRCECASIGVQFKHYYSAFAEYTKHPAGRPARVGFTLQWSLICSGGTAAACSGRIKIHPPRGTDLKLVTPAGAINCSGGCKKVFTHHVGGAQIEFRSSHDLLPDNRAGKTFTFTVEKICAKKGKDEKVGKTTLTLVYNKSGDLDRRHSDLSGDRPRPPAPTPKK